MARLCRTGASTDVGDVAEILDGVEPSAVVAFAPPGATSRNHLVKALTEQTIRITATRQRSNGRDRVSHLSCAQIARRTLEIYLDITQ